VNLLNYILARNCRYVIDKKYTFFDLFIYTHILRYYLWGAYRNNMKLISMLSIKHKTYLLVGLIVLVVLIQSLVSNDGLNTLRQKLDDLVFSTQIERYTSKLILEEQRYRLNANGSL